METINEDKIVFWIHRLIGEKVKQLNEIGEEISILNHQAENFNKMERIWQRTVIQDLNKEFKKLGWNYEIKEVLK
ncbi:hypothetical protein M0R04_11400 [Candidatus Dojkabacteria bacterium]|jgi:hypothetical protein|nr:hypothetical protein [Candidatus Dojkabacteria bacterium]